MDSKIEWTEPDVVLQIEKDRLKASLAPTPLFWRLTGIGLGLLVVVTAISLCLVAPFESREQLLHWLRFVLFIIVFNTIVLGLIAGIPATMLLRQKTGARCEVNCKGLFQSGGYGQRINWKQVENYRFGDHEKAPGVRVLEMKIRRLERLRHFSFDPLEVDENKIREIVQHYHGTAFQS